jgi:hypothetical protein
VLLGHSNPGGAIQSVSIISKRSLSDSLAPATYFPMSYAIGMITSSFAFDADKSGDAVDAEQDGSDGRIFADGAKKSEMVRFDDIINRANNFATRSQ